MKKWVILSSLWIPLEFWLYQKSLGIVFWALARFIKKEIKVMSFSKVIQIGSAGSLTISEAAGVATVKVAIAENVGGGEAAGVLKAVASAEIDVQAAELAQLALDFLKSKLPEGLQSLVTDLEAVAIPALKNV